MLVPKSMVHVYVPASPLVTGSMVRNPAVLERGPELPDQVMEVMSGPGSASWLQLSSSL